ncbi:hypothetical protein FB451DRAFT_1167569 [Mycena latifolia]|nr:hypothetical protein FB451DRAFT_1167569 [Mycena latifolia]
MHLVSRLVHVLVCELCSVEAKRRAHTAGPFGQGSDAATRTYASTTEKVVVGCARDWREDRRRTGGRTGEASVGGNEGGGVRTAIGVGETVLEKPIVPYKEEPRL